MQLRLRFARRDQLATGLAPVGVRPCWAHKEKPLWLNSGSFEWRRGPESNRPTRICKHGTNTLGHRDVHILQHHTQRCAQF